MSDEIKTVEVAAEPEKVEAAKPEVTREDLKSKGWSKAEMDSAEKRGMIPKPEEKSEPKAEEDKKPEIVEKRVEQRDPKKEGNFLDDMDREMSPEQEKVFLETFPPGTKPRAFYFRAKNERQQRQRAEAERDRMALELKLHKERELKFEEKPAAELDADGNVIDPEDKPLTMKQLKALQKAEQETLNNQQNELTERSKRVSEAMKTQEEYAKSVIPDFDETVKLATDLVNNIEQIPEKWKKDKVIKLLKDLQVTAGTADKYGVDDYNASMIAYELGQLHPKYGQKSASGQQTDKDGTKSDPKANGSLTPEQMKRLEENTQRRASSASLPGSSAGRRVVSVEDITTRDVLRMSPEERYKFKKDHPEKMSALMRG